VTAWLVSFIGGRAAGLLGPGLKWGALALAVLLFVAGLRRAGEKAGRMAERLEAKERANEINRRMLAAGAAGPRSRDQLTERLRDGSF